MQISCKKDDPPTKDDPPKKPALTTLTVSEISETTAKSGGNITDDGGSEVNSKGIVWSTTSYPTVESFVGIINEGGGSGVFTSVLTNLTPSTTYYVRAYATNSAGTAYGAQQMFTTQATTATQPTVTTSSITNITHATADGGGNVASQGISGVTARGVCWSTSPNPTTANSTTSNGTGTGPFTSDITGLFPSTTYYVRAYATNSAGTAYGALQQFTTQSLSATQPTVTTLSITNITLTTAAGGGNVTSQGISAVTARGVCWSPSPHPTIVNLTTNNEQVQELIHPTSLVSPHPPSIM